MSRIENTTDPRGSDTDSSGVPYVESLTHQERRRGMFWRWRLNQTPEVRDPQSPLPDNLPSTEDPKPKVRGRPFQKGWNRPGI